MAAHCSPASRCGHDKNGNQPVNYRELLLDCGNYLGRKPRNEFMKRYGTVIGVREEKLAEYKRLHAAVWPDVLRMIKECCIQNYSIYLRKMPDGRHFLFSYFEYTGRDFAADMAKMAADPVTQERWAVCKPCQQPLADRAPDEWWAGMGEVFHQD